MFGLSAIYTFFIGSKTAKFITVCIAAAVGLFGYGQYKEWRGGEKREAKIIENTKAAGRKNNAKSGKIRRNINPSDAGNSLWKQYGTD